MATAINMPRQGNTVETCTVIEWNKQKGDTVAEGDVLFTYETDKASFEYESPVAGTLLDTFFDTNVDIPVLTTVAVVGAAGESYDDLRPAAAQSAQSAPAPAAPAAPAPQAVAAPSAATPATASSAASPRARALAAAKGIDTSPLSGSGPKGRVIERDVVAAAAAAPLTTPAAAAALTGGGLRVPSAGTGIGGRIRAADLLAGGSAAAAAAGLADEVTEVKLSKIRTIIAERMMSSLGQAAQLTMNVGANASGLLAYRARVKAAGQKLGLNDINITDLVAYALSRTLVQFPGLNATVEGSTVRQYRHVHLALAVDTPRGLMVPVVRFADALPLNELSAALKTVAAQCNDGSINPDLLTGGTLTLSNLGTFGVESFTPILNRPQVAILGLNTIVPKPVMGDNGEYRMEPHIGLSLTIDHRAVDGAPAARFLRTLVQAIENIELTLAR